MTPITVRYFAVLAERAGCAAERLDVPTGATGAEIREALAARHDAGFAAQLRVSTLIACGQRLDAGTPLPPSGASPSLEIDALPPFAGG